MRKDPQCIIIVVDPFLTGDHFIVRMKKIFRDIAVLGRHGDKFFIVKRNAEFFCETKTDLAASAAEFAADCNDLLIISSSLYMIFLLFCTVSVLSAKSIP